MKQKNQNRINKPCVRINSELETILLQAVKRGFLTLEDVRKLSGNFSVLTDLDIKTHSKILNKIDVMSRVLDREEILEILPSLNEGSQIMVKKLVGDKNGITGVQLSAEISE